MADYGVTPTGFVRKPLPVILAEIEAKVVETFGVGVIQTPESPFGQLNGLFSSLATTFWEINEDTYQSYDVDQAEGIRLEQLGRMRLLGRIEGELDPAYRAAITNADRARLDIADIERAAASASGVTWCKAFVTGRCSTIQGMPSRAIAVAVIGGEDDDIAVAVRPYVVPGIDLYGNTQVDLIVDGYCRSYELVRPAMIALGLQLHVRFTADRLGCPPPSATAVSETIAAAFTGPSRPENGRDVTLHLLRTILAAAYPNVEIVSATATLLPDGLPVPLPYMIRFLEMATVDPDNVTVTVV